MPQIIKKQKKKVLTKSISKKKVVTHILSKTKVKMKSNSTLLKSKLFKKPKPKPKKKFKPKAKILKPRKKENVFPVKLEKHFLNPIISPSFYSWESRATFNPTAFISEGKINLIYRAVGDDDTSVLGYATSYDGLNIEERPTYAIYKRSFHSDTSIASINYLSGGGWSGGCEDPRVTLIGDTLYLIYTAFDGWGSVRMALTSIALSDFKKKKWNWKKAVLISPPGEINKNWVLFPEKINGKYALMHSFFPKILIEYFNSLDELDGRRFIKSNNTRPIDHARTWDSWFRGVGPSPIKTKDGWLVIYHAMEHHNPDRYRMGALLLDLNDPTKILYRSEHPILEPEEHYENNGHKWGVVYTCGAVVKKGTLFVYYGGADKFVCVASIPLDELIESLKIGKVVKLKSNTIVTLK